MGLQSSKAYLLFLWFNIYECINIPLSHRLKLKQFLLHSRMFRHLFTFFQVEKLSLKQSELLMLITENYFDCAVGYISLW